MILQKRLIPSNRLVILLVLNFRLNNFLQMAIKLPASLICMKQLAFTFNEVAIVCTGIWTTKNTHSHRL